MNGHLHTPEQVEIDDRAKYLTCMVANVVYCMDILHVTEIIGMQAITNLPGAPPAIRGLINLRGKVIPILDVRLRFGLPELEYTDRTCIIVIQRGELALGLLVDKVLDVIDLKSGEIDSPDTLGQGHNNDYICGVTNADGGVKFILEPSRLFQIPGLGEGALSEVGG